MFEENLDNCTLSEDKKEIETANCKYQLPTNLINLCQTSIKDGIEELLIGTIENKRNFSIIKKMIIFSENSIEQVKTFFCYDTTFINYTYIFGKEFIENRNISVDLFRTIGFTFTNKIFDDVVKRKLAKIISPSWHSYQEGRIGIHPIGVQRLIRFVGSWYLQLAVSISFLSSESVQLSKFSSNILMRRIPLLGRIMIKSTATSLTTASIYIISSIDKVLLNLHATLAFCLESTLF
jgi:hypothetical protein